MMKTSRRTLVGGALALSCACWPGGCVTPTQTSGGAFVCPPCGCAMDDHVFDAPGQCPACGMSLVPRDAVEQRIAPSALRADFTALYEGLRQAHFNLYAQLSRDDTERLFRGTLATLERPLTVFEAKAQFQRFAAAGRVAHARIDFLAEAFAAFRGAGGKAFPFAVRIDAGRVYVVQNLSGIDSIEPRCTIEELNGQSMADWLIRLGRYVSADNDYLKWVLMEPQFNALLWLEAGEIDAFRMRTRRSGGQIRYVDVPARSRAEMRANAGANPSLLQIDSTERIARMISGSLAYLRPGVFLNLDQAGDPYDPSAFHAFIDGAFTQFLTAGATRVLIDLRDNPGGDNSFSDHMVAWFAKRPFRFCSDFRVHVSAQAIAANAERLATEPPGGLSHRFAQAYATASPGQVIHFDVPPTAPRDGARFEGHVNVLVNRRSYSNAVAVAALVQDYGFGTVSGEPTADLATTYGSMEHFALPSTGISVGFPKAYIIRPNGDRRVQGVTPELIIETPIVETADDPVLQAVIRAMSN